MLKKLILALLIAASIGAWADVVNLKDQRGSTGGTLPVQSGGDSPDVSLTQGLFAYWKLNELSGVREDVSRPADELLRGIALPTSSYIQGTITGGHTTAATFSVWVWITGALANKYFVDLDDGAGTSVLRLGLDNSYVGTNTQMHGFVTGNNVGYATGGYKTGFQYHIVGVYDGTQSTNATRLRLYVNGVQGSLSFSGTIPASVTAPTRLTIGSKGDGTMVAQGNYYNAAYWNRALSGSEVTTLFNDAVPLNKAATVAALGSSGLVSFWDLNYATAMLGSTLSDSVGSNTLTMVGSPAIAPPYRRKDGSFFYNYVAGLNFSPELTAFTYSIWYRPGSLPAAGATLGVMDKGNSATTSEFGIYLSNTGGASNFKAFVSSTGNSADATTTNATLVNINTWYHLMFIWDGANINLYVNNVAGDSPAFSSSLYNGAGTWNLNGYQNNIIALGSYDSISVANDVIFWNRALDSTERAAVYNGGTALRYQNLSSSVQSGVAQAWDFGYETFFNYASLVGGVAATCSGTQTYGSRSYTSNTGVVNLPLDLTDNNTVLKGGGVGSYAANFVSASSQYLSVDSPWDESTWTAMTVLSWTYRVSGDGGGIGVWDDGASSGLSFLLQPAGTQTVFYVSTNGTAPATSRAGNLVPANEWSLSAGVWNGSNIRVHHISGTYGSVVSATTAFAGPLYNSTRKFLVGAYNNGWSYFNGRMQGTAIWNRELSTAEIEAIYNSGRGLRYEQLSTAQKVGLLEWFPLSESSGNRTGSHGAVVLAPTNTPGRLAGIVNSATTSTGAETLASNTEYLSTTAAAWFQPSDPFTVAIWFNRSGAETMYDNGPMGLNQVGGLGWGGIFTGIVGGSGNNKLDFGVWNTAGAGFQTAASSTIDAGSWNLAIGWYNPVTRKAYLQLNNGSILESATVTGTRNVVGGVYAIGGYDNIRRLSGTYEETAVWGRLLTEVERTYLYNGGASRTYSDGRIQ